MPFDGESNHYVVVGHLRRYSNVSNWKSTWVALLDAQQQIPAWLDEAVMNRQDNGMPAWERAHGLSGFAVLRRYTSRLKDPELEAVYRLGGWEALFAELGVT